MAIVIKVIDKALRGIRAQSRAKWQQDARTSSTPQEVNSAHWKQLKQSVGSGKQKDSGLRRFVEEIVFLFTYPRLDLELMDELNLEESRMNDSSPPLQDWERTSLATPIGHFQSSFLEPLVRSCKAELENNYKAKLQELAAGHSLQW